MNNRNGEINNREALERTGLGIAAMFGTYWIYTLFLRERIPLSEGMRSLVGLLCLYVLGLGAFVYMTKGVQVPRHERKKISPKAFGLCFLLQFTALMVMVVFVNILTAFGMGMVQEEIDTLSLRMLFLLLVFNPFMEELVFRKMFADRLLRYGEGGYILASAFCFAIVHGVSLGAAQVLYTFILGLVWAYVMAKTGDLLQVAALHAASNLFGSVIMQRLLTISEAAAGIYSLLLMAAGVVGLVLFLVNKKNIAIDGERILFKKRTLANVFGNRGIWVYIALTLMAVILK